MKTALILAAIAATSIGSVAAQNNNNNNADQPTSKDTGTRFWEARLAGGSYMVALNRVTSISKHTYLVGNIEVTEVVIDTDGNSLARFYAATSAGSDADVNIIKNTQNRLEELTREQGARAGLKGTPVVKNYPTTTHAKTVEYNVDNTKALDSLFNSVKRAWERNKGARFTSK